MVYLTNILLFSGPALTLLMRSGYIVMGLSFFVLTLVLLLNKENRNWPFDLSVKRMSQGFWAYAAIAIFIHLYHAQISKHIEAFLPMLLYPLLFFVVPKLPLRAHYLWTGAATGAIGAGLVAIYQAKVLGIVRADGFYYNPIPFGDIALVLSAASLIALLQFPFEKHTKLLKLWLAMGGAFGMIASLLSGTRGGWLTLLTLVLFSAWVLSSKWTRWKRWLSLLTACLLIATAVHLSPRANVMDRIEKGLSGGITWVKTGQVTDGSVSLRLALFAEGFGMFKERPILGWEWRSVHAEQERRLREKGVDPVLSSTYGAFENEVIDKLVGFGLMGLISVVCAFVFPFWAFWRYRLDRDAQIRCFATMGMLLPIMFMEFGLSVSVLSLNAMRHVYVAWCVILMCLILHRQRELEAT